MIDSTRFVLDQKDMPTHWYNIQADIPDIGPYKDAEGNPIPHEALHAIFAPELVEQEFSKERYIEIPEEVQDILRTYRPSPLSRARQFEKALGLPDNVKIYYKYEGVNASGSHKANTAIPQVFYNQKAGIKKIATETGAGQWGAALSMAGSQYGMDIEVFMVKVSYNQKPYRRIFMETFGATVHPSPSTRTAVGRAALERDPDTLGSLGMAISEAVEIAATNPDTNYALGSVLNHVCLHQTIIGEEAILQMEMAGEEPDVIVACAGGGSNFAGLAFPYYRRKLEGKSKARLVAVEPKACPTLTCGEFRYDFGDDAALTPAMPMYTLGSEFVPSGIHAGGLRYHGDSPLLSKLYQMGEMDAMSVYQNECFEAAVLFSQTEAMLPAPESAHAIAGAVHEAKAAAKRGEKCTILFNLTGHGFLDLPAYDAYNRGELKDYDYSTGEVIETKSILED